MSGEKSKLNDVPRPNSGDLEEVAMLPLEAIDKAIGTQIKILMSNNKEFHGTLIGFDDFVNVVLKDVTEVSSDSEKRRVMGTMLLNGTQIAMLCPA